MKLYLCDEDEKYIYRLADYIENSGNYTVAAFSDAESFIGALTGKLDNDFACFLEEGIYERVRQSGAGQLLREGKLYCLTADRKKDGACSEGLDYVYKYQSAAKIRETLEANGNHQKQNITGRADVYFRTDYIGKTQVNHSPVIEKGSIEKTAVAGNIICVYSPIGRCLKTTFSLTLGQLLSEEENVLYINMESYSGLSKMLGIKKEQNLSDFIYDYTLNSKNVLDRENQYIATWKTLKIMMPSFEAELQEIETESWMEVLSFLAGCGRFGYIIIDPGSCIKGITDIFQICKTIFMPVKKDRIAALKLDEFETVLKRKGQQAETKKIRRLYFPYFKELAEAGGMFGKLDGALCEFIRKEGLLSFV